jgi:hypothetical protein
MPTEMEYALLEVCCMKIRKKSQAVQEALRLYFRTRSGKVEPLPLVMPNSDNERRHVEMSAFGTEWASSLDRVYDTFGQK